MSDTKRFEVGPWAVTTLVRETISLSAGEFKTWASRGGEVVVKDGRQVETPYRSHDLLSVYWTRAKWARGQAEIEVRVSNGEMAGVALSVTAPWLMRVQVKVAAPRRLIAPWVLDAREFAVTIGGPEVAEVRAAWEPDSAGQRRYLLEKERRGDGRSYAGKYALWQGLRFGKSRYWWATALLGKGSCDIDVTGRGETTVPMPEGNYNASWERERRTWRRARVPFPLKTREDVSLEIPGGIPVPGKGENSWDIDDDGIFGTGGASVEAAVANAVSAAIRERRRHAGPRWVPDAGWPDPTSRADGDASSPGGAA